MNDEHSVFPIIKKLFVIDIKTAKNLIKVIRIAENEGYGYDGVQELLEKLETWVKQ